MSIVVFTDLDDTLIQTEKKCPSNEKLTTTATDKEGQPASYSTSAQLSLFDWCSAQSIIPVTGRNKQALDRVSLPFTQYKVIDHGAIILNQQNLIDPEWLELIKTQSQQWVSILELYLSKVEQEIRRQQLSLRCRIISDFDIACYISIKGEADDLDKLNVIADQFSLQDANARVHINGSNMALLAPYSCKKRAVEFLQKRFRQENSSTLFIGAGDSNSDLPFMQSCHFQVIPTTSQITRDKLS